MTRQREKNTFSQRNRLSRNSAVNPCVKYMLFLSNFIFCFASIVLAGLMVWLLSVNRPVLSRLTDLVFNPAIILLIGGLFVFFLTFFGCIGALRENVCFLKFFHICLSAFLVLKTLLGIFIFVCIFVHNVREKLPWDHLHGTLFQAIRYYHEHEHTDLVNFIDSVQQNLQCCGVVDALHGYRDWQQNRYFNCSDSNLSLWRCGVPSSCCKSDKNLPLRNTQCGLDVFDRSITDVANRIYTRGCLVGLNQWLDHNALILGSICFGLIVPQALAIVLSCVLATQIRTQRCQSHLIGKTTIEVGPLTDYTDTYTLI